MNEKPYDRRHLSIDETLMKNMSKTNEREMRDCPNILTNNRYFFQKENMIRIKKKEKYENQTKYH